VASQNWYTHEHKHEREKARRLRQWKRIAERKQNEVALE
jgi:hypothetical protein